ncbi:MAG: hypothetical protein AAGF71_14255, partial [Pseudomonadota bacterium]
RHTVIYDAVWLPDGSSILVTAPRFINLLDPFKAGLPADAKIEKHKVFGRFEQLQIAVPGPQFAVHLDGQDHELAIRPSLTSTFAGLRGAVTLNKNNHLDWIHDWAHYYVSAHGLEAVVLFDNGSDGYSIEDIVATLSKVPGLKKGAVFSAPFPFGPSGGGKPHPRFFQTAMMNIARADCFSQARSALNCDIDEFIIKTGDRTIFEATEAHPFGLVTSLGYWAYPASFAPGPQNQAAHTHWKMPKKKINRKWCVVPQSIVGRNWPWEVHQNGGFIQNWFSQTKEFEHIHCRACSTGWKSDRFEVSEHEHQFDPHLDKVLRAHLPARSFAGE